MRRKTVFLSYAHEDRTLAERLAKCLEKDGLTVWWDRFLHFGDNISTRVDDKLVRASAVILLWSRAASASRWVQAESARAFEQGRLIPVRLDESDLPVPVRELRTTDLIGWDGNRSDSRYSALLTEVRSVRDSGWHPDSGESRRRTLRRVGVGAGAILALALASMLAVESRRPIGGQIAVRLQRSGDRLVGLDHEFRKGDSIRFEIVTDRDAWVTLLYAPPGGEFAELLPRRLQITADTPRLVPPPPARLVLDTEVGLDRFVARFETASSAGGLGGIRIVPYAQRQGPYTSFSAEPGHTDGISIFRFELSHGESRSSSP